MPSLSNYQSMRASCNRCRFHKLKCIVSSSSDKSGSQQCERCVRAKVDCIFSQRARAKRPSARSESSSSNDVDMSSIASLPCPSTTAHGVEDFFSTSLESSHLNPAEIWGTLDGANCSAQSDIHTNHTSRFGSCAGEQPYPPMLGSELRHLTMNEQISPPSVHHGQDPSFTSSPSMSSLMHECIQPQTPEKFDEYISKTIMRLSNLVANIHKTLGSLYDNWHCTKSPRYSFTEYPIGSVLHLAREFTEIVTEIKRSRATTPYECSEGSITPIFIHKTAGLTPNDSTSSTSSFESFLNQDFHHDQSNITPPLSSSPGSFAETIDSPTTLLVMSCYLSLRRLYHLVFTHFEIHLSMLLQTPSSNGLFVPKGRELQLGELPSADETCSRIYTAVKLLLDMLQSGEDMLGLPSTIGSPRGACGYLFSMLRSEGPDGKSLFHGELALAVLEKANFGDCNNMQEGPDGLCAKVQSLKRMLLEKM